MRGGCSLLFAALALAVPAAKFLVDREGRVVERYAPTTTPEAIDADIAKLL